MCKGKYCRSPIILTVYLGLLWIAGNLISCKSEIGYECSDIEDYHQAQIHATSGRPSQSKRVDVFIDYSKSMHQPIMNSSSYIYQLQGILEGRNTTYYRVGEKAPHPIDIESDGNILTSLDSYKEVKTRLVAALDKITSHSETQSILITDFERDADKRRNILTSKGKVVSTSIDLSSWAKPAFMRWLEAGNQIDFYITDFEKFGMKKHMYITLFTPKSLTGDAGSIQQQFYEALDKVSVEPGSEPVTHLSFSLQNLNARALSGNKGDPISENYADTEQFCPNPAFPERDYEHYVIIRKAFDNYIRENSTLFLRSVRCDFRQITGFSLQEVSVKGDIITAPFETFLYSKEDSSFSFNELASSEKMDDIWMGELNQDTIKLSIRSEEDLFALNSGEWIRLRIYPRDAQIDLRTVRNALTWESRSNIEYEVESLYTSIQEAMRELLPQTNRQVIFTYYIHII